MARNKKDCFCSFSFPPQKMRSLEEDKRFIQQRCPAQYPNTSGLLIITTLHGDRLHPLQQVEVESKVTVGNGEFPWLGRTLFTTTSQFYPIYKYGEYSSLLPLLKRGT